MPELKGEPREDARLQEGYKKTLEIIASMLSAYKEDRNITEGSENATTVDRIMQTVEAEISSIKAPEDVQPRKQPILHKLLHILNFYNSDNQKQIEEAFEMLDVFINEMLSIRTPFKK